MLAPPMRAEEMKRSTAPRSISSSLRSRFFLRALRSCLLRHLRQRAWRPPSLALWKFSEVAGKDLPQPMQALYSDTLWQQNLEIRGLGSEFHRLHGRVDVGLKRLPHLGGDVGRFDEDGFLTLMDRTKDMIISGGFNIYPSDLEAVLAKDPAVVECAVIGAPSEDWGETPVGFVVLRPGSDADQVLATANAQVGKTQRLNRLIVVDELPRSPIGKVLKRELRDQLAG